MTTPENQKVGTSQTVWAAIASYDVTTKQPKSDVAQLLQNLTVRLGEELEVLREEHAAAKEEIAEATQTIAGLRRQLRSKSRLQLLVSLLALAGAILIGFGVNFLTDANSSPGWVMLGLGSLLQLGSVATLLVEAD